MLCHFAAMYLVLIDPGASYKFHKYLEKEFWMSMHLTLLGVYLIISTVPTSYKKRLVFLQISSFWVGLSCYQICCVPVFSTIRRWAWRLHFLLLFRVPSPACIPNTITSSSDLAGLGQMPSQGGGLLSERGVHWGALSNLLAASLAFLSLSFPPLAGTLTWHTSQGRRK